MHFWRKLIYHEKFRRKAKGGRTNGPPERSSYLEKMKIRISIYFEIKDSEMFGGVGSIGYAERNMDFTGTDKKTCIFKDSAYDYVKKAIANMVESLGVSEACIRTISKEEYKENTENEYDEKS